MRSERFLLPTCCRLCRQGPCPVGSDGGGGWFGRRAGWLYFEYCLFEYFLYGIVLRVFAVVKASHFLSV